MTDGVNSNPFVGLRPFESEESILFFGRQEQTLDLLQRLHKYHFVAVVGGSGSGKSSLIRAGLVPRLKAGFLVNDNGRWAISVMKPGESPLYNLAEAISTQLTSTDNTLTPTAILEKIQGEGTDAILEILKQLWKTSTNFFLLVDQFEELFRFSLNQMDLQKKDDAIDFVKILLELSAQKDLPVYVVITMRSDFIGDCAQFSGLPEAMNQSQYLVPRLNRSQLKNSIEGPVTLYKGTITPRLISKLLNDLQLVKDELPLLQHCLMRMWDHKKKLQATVELDLPDYNAIGGIEKALSIHADEALKGMTEPELQVTKKIFQALTAIDQNGRKIRRPVLLTELVTISGADRNTLLSIIDRFIKDNRSFLVKNKAGDSDDFLIDISHESLIRQWSTLNTWVDEEAESGKVFLRLSESAALYKERKKDLLTGNELLKITEWYYSFKPGAFWAKRYNPAFEDDIRYLKSSEDEERKQRLKKINNRRLLIAALILVIIIISGFAFSIYKNNIENKKQLVLNYWKNSHTARGENNFLDALHLVAEAAAINDNNEINKTLLIDGEAYLPHTCLKSIYLQNDIITSITFSNNGQRILVGSNDGTVRVIDKITGRELITEKIHDWPVNSAVFSPDDKWILTASNDNTARIWDATSGNQLRSFEHPSEVTSAVFSPDGKFILTGMSDNYAQIWDIAAGNKIDSFYHAADVTSAVFSPDGTKILTTSNEFIPHLWDRGTKKEIPFLNTSISKNESVVTSAFFSRDGTKILAVDADSTVRIYEINGELAGSLKHTDRVTDAAISPDGNWVVTASHDKSARLWNMKTQTDVGTIMKNEGPVYSVSFSADGRQILTGGRDKMVRLWDTEIEPVENKINLFKHNGIVKTGVFNPDGTKIFTGSYDSTARLWDIVTGNEIYLLKHKARVNSVVFNPDGRKGLTASDDSTIHIWDTSTGKQTDSLKLTARVTCAVVSADGKLLLTVTNDNYVRIMDITGQAFSELYSFKYAAEVTGAIFSSDTKNILIASADSAAHILNISSGKELISFKHDDIVTGAVYSPDSKSVLTSSWDKTVRLWEVATGKQIGPAMKHNAYVNSAVFSPDGKWILTAGWDKAAHLWYTATLKEIGIAKKYAAALNSAVFSPDGKSLLTSGYDSIACVSEIGGDIDLPADLFKLQAKAISGVEYNRENGETRCMEAKKWSALKKEYDARAADHFKSCKYQRYNLWRRFNKGAAERTAKK